MLQYNDFSNAFFTLKMTCSVMLTSVIVITFTPLVRDVYSLANTEQSQALRTLSRCFVQMFFQIGRKVKKIEEKNFIFTITYIT
jgi:hypothetical protein